MTKPSKELQERREAERQHAEVEGPERAKAAALIHAGCEEARKGAFADQRGHDVAWMTAEERNELDQTSEVSVS